MLKFVLSIVECTTVLIESPPRNSEMLRRSQMFIVKRNGAVLVDPAYRNVALCLNSMEAGERSAFIVGDVIYHIRVFLIVNVSFFVY